MGRLFKIAAIALAPLITSCGKGVTEVSSAPKTQDQAGIIASCASVQEAKSFAQSYGARYRVINAKRKLIEFYDTDETTIKAAFPKSRTKKNIVYEYQLVQSGFPSVQSYGDFPFYGAHTPQYRVGHVSRYFPHLAQIDGEGFIQDKQGQGVTIAVVDTGVYYNHPHISPNIKTNNSDKHGSGANNRDDDGNGYKDDYAGWDFYNGDAYPLDDHGHGTHVAGLAAGTYGGVAPKAKILPVKVLGANGRGDLGTIAAGILYAVDMGAHIINLSLGGPAAGQASNDVNRLLSAVIKANSRGALLVAAAGNGGEDGLGDCNDASPVYPASFDQENVLSVASVDRYNHITSYSNFGTASVHVAAPGGDDYSGGLMSLGIPNCYGPCPDSAQQYVAMSGTSMATPVVAGIAALVKSAATKLNYKQIKQIIMRSGIDEPSLVDKVQSGKVVNAAAATREALEI